MRAKPEMTLDSAQNVRGGPSPRVCAIGGHRCLPKISSGSRPRLANCLMNSVTHGHSLVSGGKNCSLPQEFAPYWLRICSGVNWKKDLTDESDEVASGNFDDKSVCIHRGLCTLGHDAARANGRCPSRNSDHTPVAHDSPRV